MFKKRVNRQRKQRMMIRIVRLNKFYRRITKELNYKGKGLYKNYIDFYLNCKKIYIYLYFYIDCKIKINIILLYY